jgi:beta-N-acetylhexosaminidase
VLQSQENHIADTSLAEKIGQMIMLGFNGQQLSTDSPIGQAILNKAIGGVILFDQLMASQSCPKNITSPNQLATLTQSLQALNQTACQAQPQNCLPLLIGIDYEGGRVNRLKTSAGFPPAYGANEVAIRGDQVAHRVYQQMAQTLKQSGINLNFAPVVDLNICANNPVIGQLGRSYGDNPQQVCHYAAIALEHYRQQQILCALKHFPGHGSSTRDSHLGFVDVTASWQPVELEPYRLLNHQTDMVMSAHIVNKQLDPEGYPATLSKPMLTGLLREDLEFQGVIITDDLQMSAISQHYGDRETIIGAVNAGADILLFGNQLVSEDHYQTADRVQAVLVEAVNTGVVKKTTIDQSYGRIVRLKKRFKF